jgi:hypothetical protein
MDKISKILEALIKVEDTKINQLDMLSHFLEEMTDITHDFLIWLVDYCKRNNIPLWKEEQFRSYVLMSEKILKDIDESTTTIKDLTESRKLPPNKSHKRSPEDLPEPKIEKFKYCKHDLFLCGVQKRTAQKR